VSNIGLGPKSVPPISPKIVKISKNRSKNGTNLNFKLDDNENRFEKVNWSVLLVYRYQNR
jgi:hypothetical protein